MREILIKAYLDYLNNYLTVEKFAEHNGLLFLLQTNCQLRAIGETLKSIKRQNALLKMGKGVNCGTLN